MTTPPTSQTNPLDPVFSGVPVVYPQTGMVNPTWNKWFVDLRQKLNVINAETATPVVKVHAGTNVTVDNTDPQNPIVSASGGGGGSGTFITGINTKTSTPYILSLGDVGTLVDMNVSSNSKITIPKHSSVAFPVSSTIQVGCRSNTLTIQPEDSSISVINALSPAAGSGNFAGLVNIGADFWYLWGNASYANAFTAYQSTILADTPVGFWPLNETSGTTAADISGNGNPMAYINTPTLGTAAIAANLGVCPLLNGTNQYIQLTTPPSLLQRNTGSFEIWMKSPVVLSGAAILCSGYVSGAVNFVLGMGSSVGGNSGSLIYGGAYTGSGWVGELSTTTQAANALYHIVMTCDGTTYNLYINGSSVGTSAATGFTANNLNIYIGYRWYQSAGTAYSNAYVSNAAIYSSVLTSAQVLAHYNAGI